MTSGEYDVVFVGGGLAATLLLNELRPALPRRVAVLETWSPSERPPVHWSYWSSGATPYDGFAIGAWRRARVADARPEPIAPYALLLVRSTDVLAPMIEALRDLPIEWLRATARSIVRRSDGGYEVVSDAGTVRARWVFDSACEVVPAFPSPRRPRAVLSGTGLRVEADQPVFDAGVATLFDPLDERSFAYVLPLSSAEALVESASFGSTGVGEDRATLLRYLRAKHPKANFTVTHSEYGAIPLGFAPPAYRRPAPRPDRGEARSGEAQRRLRRRPHRPGKRASGTVVETTKSAAAKPASPLAMGAARRGVCAARHPGPPTATGFAEPRHARHSPRSVIRLHRGATLGTTTGPAPPVSRPHHAS